MKDFVFYNPDKVFFGKNAMEHFSEEIKKYGKKALLVYGGGSIKKIGLYDEVVDAVNESDMELFELSGVTPNPRHTTVNEGAAICKKENIDLILAVGGGSTIDCAKGIAAAALTESGDVWPLVKNGVWVTEALPIVAVLTNAATGSEMDEWAVISNMETNEKIGLGGSALLPKVAFENPLFSYSLSSYQTACGAFDIFNHIIDNYYFANNASFDIMTEFQEAVMRIVVKWAPIAMKEPTNYEARANLMWASSMALNGVTDGGTVHSCACHLMEHELSAYYDITHGHGLAIVTPRWLAYQLDEETAPAIKRFGVKVFGCDESLEPMEGAKEAIKELSKFCFETLGLKSNLRELGIDETHLKEMAEHACAGGELDSLKTLNKEDCLRILEMCL